MALLHQPIQIPRNYPQILGTYSLSSNFWYEPSTSPLLLIPVNGRKGKIQGNYGRSSTLPTASRQVIHHHEDLSSSPRELAESSSTGSEWIYYPHHLSASSSSSSSVESKTSTLSAAAVKTKVVEDEKRNYYLNMGYAIRTLREETKELFYKEPSFHIYREDIVFSDPMNTFSGIDNYKRIFWALRVYGRILFKTIRVDILRVWQPADNIIMIRWTAHGIPRILWETQGRFDATSEYKLDKDGKIYVHKVDNVAVNSPPKFKVLFVEELIQSLGCPSTPRPTYFEFLPDHSQEEQASPIHPQLRLRLSCKDSD